MIPTNFLTRINQYLCHRYPPPLKQVHRVEKVIRVLSAKLAHCSGALVVPYVVHLQEGVVQWLQDKDHLSKQERYEEFVSTSRYRPTIFTNFNIVDTSFLLQCCVRIALRPITRGRYSRLGSLSHCTFFEAELYRENPSMSERLLGSNRRFLVQIRWQSTSPAWD